MSLEIDVSKAIDALDVTPVGDDRRRRAALTVCTTMHAGGHSLEQIREVLGCLDLLAVGAAT